MSNSTSFFKKSNYLTLSQISDIVYRINSEQDLHSLLIIIMDTARELLNTEGASLLLYDEITGDLVFDIARGDRSNLLARQRVPAGKGIAGECVKTLKPIIVNDAQNDPRLHREIDESSGFKTKKLIAVPMLARNQIIGVLEAVNTLDGRDFKEKDVRLLMFLSGMAGIAIHNRRLYNELKTRMDELNCIFEISQAIYQYDHIEPLLDGILKAISKVLEVERLSIILKDENREFYVKRTLGFQLEENDIRIDPTRGISSIVLKSGEPLLIKDVVKELGISTENASKYKTKSFISVPIKREREVIGILNVADKINGMPFDQFELKVLQTVANQLASAYQRIEARKREFEIKIYKKDLETAAEIQKNSLPDIPSEIAGFQLGAGYQMCRDVGGDFYDFYYHNDNMLSLVIADVSGKGVPAALFMEYSKTLLGSYIPRYLQPMKTLQEVNEELIKNSRIGLFVTVMLVQIEKELKRLRIASAGHNYQILYRTESQKVEFISAKGPPLGAIPKVEYKENLYHYDPGDLLVLYTDGITEACKENYEQYGIERLVEVIKKYHFLHPKELVHKIFEDVQNYIGNFEMMDDATLMVVRLS
ncbi:MAG: SpoIIE family protein phosphatase [Leptospiraceae bacterium]|nr:SpoIIE family protein phosphatase [Leptospiraceae bacterium]MDW7976660.1 SpoIIE family protein phosphatase [Leptospiraceae bacterium]